VECPICARIAGVIARHLGTPREYWWTRVNERPDAPSGDAEAIAALCARLRSHL
jgi:histidine triad (HIT) family protein